MARICDAISRYSKVKVEACAIRFWWVCLVGITLASDLNFHVPPGITGSHATPSEIPCGGVATQA